MKKRICFVGFSDSELDGFQATLGQPGTNWECIGSTDCTSVLSLIEGQPVDALVADLAKISSDVATLFQKVAATHPNTLRFALGDVSDHERVVTSLGAPYQFISRPWKLPELM